MTKSLKDKGMSMDEVLDLIRDDQVPAETVPAGCYAVLIQAYGSASRKGSVDGEFYEMHEYPFMSSDPYLVEVVETEDVALARAAANGLAHGVIAAGLPGVPGFRSMGRRGSGWWLQTDDFGKLSTHDVPYPEEQGYWFEITVLHITSTGGEPYKVSKFFTGKGLHKCDRCHENQIGPRMHKVKKADGSDGLVCNSCIQELWDSIDGTEI